jgi:hypothetical protein
MSAARNLPARPSLESLRKQAKRLARATAAGNREAIARIEAQLSRAQIPFSNRDAQLVIAREYGFAGWPALLAEVNTRIGNARMDRIASTGCDSQQGKRTAILRLTRRTLLRRSRSNEDAVKFLINHGAVLTMTNYRFHSTAEGCARYVSRDERMANCWRQNA